MRREALERVLMAPEFAQAGRMNQLLRFLGEQTLAGRAGDLKETVVGVEVFGRSPGYDPKVDSVVRTEVRRLRLKLQEFYAGGGAEERVRVEIPKGGYEVVFVEVAEVAVAVAPVVPKPEVRNWVWIVAGLAFVALLGGWMVWRTWTGGKAAGLPQPQLLTSSIGQATHPQLTRDGKVLVYALSNGAESGIYLLRLDGRSTPERLAGTRAKDYQPALTSAGDRVAYLREERPGQFALLVQGVGGGDAKQWATLNRRDRMEWMPDGKRLLVSASVDGRGAAQLQILDEGGGRKVVTTPPSGVLHDGLPVLSPDGKQLAFLRAADISVDEIYVVDLGKDDLPVAEPRRVTEENRRISGMAYLPDGKHLVASLPRGRSIRGLWKIPIGNPKDAVAMPEAGLHAVYPAVAAGSGRMVYSIGVDDLNLYLVDLKNGTSGGALLASSTLESSPALSPDGERVAFRSARTGSSEVWMAKVDGTEPVRLTYAEGPVTGSPRWSPDGETVVFDSRLDGNANLYWIRVNGKVGTPERLTSLPGNEVVPAFSRDGKWIYYASDQTGTWQIFRMPAPGQGDGMARQVTVAGGFRAEESLDGKWLYYSKREPGSGVWRMPLGGGPEEMVQPLPASLWGGWAITGTGIYYLDVTVPGARYLFRPHGGGASRAVANLTALPVHWDSSLAVTADDWKMIFAQLDRAISDVYSIELGR